VTASPALAAPPGLLVQRYPTATAADYELAHTVAADLAHAITRRGVATLALSGGTTPACFLRELGERPLDWSRVQVTLTDERWVPPGHPRANSTLIDQTLRRGAARDCAWHPLYCEGLERNKGIAGLNARLASFAWPLDVAVLGMGEDGHVASLFPDAAVWDAADPVEHVIAATAPTGEERVSLTLSTLRAAHRRYLLLHGARKAGVLLSSAGTRLPIAALYAHAATPVIAYLAEETHA